MRVVFAGTPQIAVPTLAAIVDAGHEVVAVVTQPDAPGKRGRVTVAEPRECCGPRTGTRRAHAQPKRRTLSLSITFVVSTRMSRRLSLMGRS